MWDISTPEGMENAKRWTETFLSMGKPEFEWHIPRSNSVIRFDKNAKTATLLTPEEDEPAVRVLIELGWTIKRL